MKPIQLRWWVFVPLFVLAAGAALPVATKDEAAAKSPDRSVDKSGAEGRKVIARHVDAMEAEAKAMRAKDPESAEVVTRVAKVLREEILEAHKSDADAGDADGMGPAYDPEAGRRSAAGGAPTRQVKATIVTAAEFTRNYAGKFPRDGNLARGGRATASGTHPEADDPITTLGGVRRRDTWCLNATRGWFQADWPAPLTGRYLFLFTRPHGGAGDAWESGLLEINGRPIARIGAFPAGHVVVADLGEAVSIKNVKVSFQGRDFPGIAGLEVHRAMRR